MQFLKISIYRLQKKLARTQFGQVLGGIRRKLLPRLDVYSLVLGLDRIDVTYPSDRTQQVNFNPAQLAADYRASPIAEATDNFVLYRIIGNDLPPRHSKGQTRDNVAWLLAHEPELERCEKYWVVNRIVDPREEEAVLQLLEGAGQSVVHVPFSWDEYEQLTLDTQAIPEEYRPGGSQFERLREDQQSRVMMRLYRHKNNYVMNNNGVRNAALMDGRGRAKWVLPWDGNCYLTERAWQEILESVGSSPEYPYHIVPMARIRDNSELLDPNRRFEANEEPQIVFRSDAQECFNPEFYYGRRPKVELLWRLGVPGPWDHWTSEPWDLPIPDYSSQAGQFTYSGWVARMASGKAHLEKGKQLAAVSIDRMLARNEAIKAMIDELDKQLLLRSGLASAK